MITVHAVRTVLLDIEGTVSSIAFVKDTLFPYARAQLPAYVHEHQRELGGIFAEVRQLEGRPDLTVDEIIALFMTWIDQDRKITPLKTLQGLIWKAGYDSGELTAHLYEDAFAALRAWHRAGLRLCIYSSGSVAAQQLLFAHTHHGDLTPLLSGYFDTRTGPKLEAASYTAIAAALTAPPASILFLSDHPGEILAARSAGLQAIRVDRESPATAPADGPAVHLFDELAIDTSA
jgi:enolase-phosphatase E1